MGKKLADCQMQLGMCQDRRTELALEKHELVARIAELQGQVRELQNKPLAIPPALTEPDAKNAALVTDNLSHVQPLLDEIAVALAGGEDGRVAWRVVFGAMGKAKRRLMVGESQAHSAWEEQRTHGHDGGWVAH